MILSAHLSWHESWILHSHTHTHTHTAPSPAPHRPLTSSARALQLSASRSSNSDPEATHSPRSPRSWLPKLSLSMSKSFMQRDEEGQRASGAATAATAAAAGAGAGQAIRPRGPTLETIGSGADLVVGEGLTWQQSHAPNAPAAESGGPAPHMLSGQSMPSLGSEPAQRLGLGTLRAHFAAEYGAGGAGAGGGGAASRAGAGAAGGGGG